MIPVTRLIRGIRVDRVIIRGIRVIRLGSIPRLAETKDGRTESYRKGIENAGRLVVDAGGGGLVE